MPVEETVTVNNTVTENTNIRDESCKVHRLASGFLDEVGANGNWSLPQPQPWWPNFFAGSQGGDTFIDAPSGIQNLEEWGKFVAHWRKESPKPKYSDLAGNITYVRQLRTRYISGKSVKAPQSQACFIAYASAYHGRWQPRKKHVYRRPKWNSKSRRMG